MEKKKIVIAGGGFSGIYTYLELLKHDRTCDCLEVTLINKTDFFSFIVLSHEVATGGLMPADTMQAIHNIPTCKDTHFIEGMVKEINLDTKEIFVERQNAVHTALKSKSPMVTERYGFDYIVTALGSDTNDYGIAGVRDFALCLKDIQDAKKIKNRILESFEIASHSNDDVLIHELLSFVVIGGGPTGVELAAEMADFIHIEMKKIYPQFASRSSVTLLQGGDRLLPPVDMWFHTKSMKILQKLKVIVLLNTRVNKITEATAETSNGSLATRNVFWTAGVKGRDVSFVSDVPVIIDPKTNRIPVTPYLNTETHSFLYVAGDLAYIVEKETGQPYPMRAQFAVREGVQVARNIIADIHGKAGKTFEWKDQGFIISLGRGGALAEAFGIRFSGFFAWWLYRTAYFSKLVGIRAKLRTGIEWAINLVFSRDVSKLS